MPNTQDNARDTITKDINEIQNVGVPIIKENVSIISKIFSATKNAGLFIWNMRITSEAMKYITWYAGILVLACTIYLIAWCYNWYQTKVADLNILLQFIHELVSSPYVAVIGFIAKMFVDKNHNGKSDILEDDDSNTQDIDVSTLNISENNMTQQNHHNTMAPPNK